MLARLREQAAGSPAFPACLAAFALLVSWAASEGGYPVTHWAPGGILLLALTVTCWLFARPHLPSRGGRLALYALFAYAAWSYLSILWAKEPGAALEGGDRALLYALLFALFSSFGLRPQAALLLLCLFLFAVFGLGVAVLLELATMGGRSLAHGIAGGRLTYPAGYVNAAPAQWTMVALPALLLARRARLAPWLRGALAAGSVVLLALAFLSLSRGWLVSLLVAAVAIVALLPGRVGSFWIEVWVGAALCADLPFLLKVGERAEAGLSPHHQLVVAAGTTLGFALLAGVGVFAFARWQRSQSYAARAIRLERVAAVGAVVLALVLVGGGLAVLGNPIAKAEKAWQTFTSQKGYEANSKDTNRLLAGFGSNRYDFYKVSFHQFLNHPLLGDGSENFLYAYLREGHSDETPRYPHSLELRVLSETGLVGALIAAVGLIAGLGSAVGAARRGGVGGEVAAASFAAFLYWLIQGSFDWFWEYSLLGGVAFALLGLAVGQSGALEPSQAKPFALRRSLLVGVAALAAGYAFAMPWLSGLAVEGAAKVYRVNPRSAYNQLALAASLDPLSPQPQLVAGTIAARRGELRRAQAEFKKALAIYPEEEYAVLELGGIAAQKGEVRRATALFLRAHALAPRDRLPQEALGALRRSERVTVAEVERVIERRAADFE